MIYWCVCPVSLPLIVVFWKKENWICIHSKKVERRLNHNKSGPWGNFIFRYYHRRLSYCWWCLRIKVKIKAWSVILLGFHVLLLTARFCKRRGTFYILIHSWLAVAVEVLYSPCWKSRYLKQNVFPFTNPWAKYMVHTIHKRRYEFRINDIFIQVLIFGLMPKWTDMLGAGQCCQQYFSNFLYDQQAYSLKF